MKTTNRILTAFVLALTLGPGVCYSGLGVGDSFPEVSRALGGKTAGSVTLVDFWASWCTPCRAAFPHLEALHREFEKDGLVVVGVGVDDQERDYQRFLKSQSITFITHHDQSQALVAKADIDTMPTSFLLDKSGRILKVFKGFHPGTTEKEIEEAVIKALEGSAAE